jgi:hypothetical protein
MNGTRARAIRRSVYPTSAASTSETRVYNRLATGQIVLGWFRRKYQEAKKEWMSNGGSSKSELT